MKTYCLDCDQEGGTLFDDGGCSLCKTKEAPGSHLSIAKKLEKLFEHLENPAYTAGDKEAIDDMYDRLKTFKFSSACLTTKQANYVYVMYDKYFR